MNPLTAIACRLLAKVKVDTVTGCWNWQAARSQSGWRGVWYPVLRVGGHLWRVNRLSLVLYLGPAAIPRREAESAEDWLWRANLHWSAYEGAHGCDNSQCVNPQHLAWETHVENVTQQVARRQAQQATA